MADDEEKVRINPGYALNQLARALSGVGETAAKRARQWTQVLTGLFDGSLVVGSRTPVKDMPPWVTLEVAHGGFATGSLAASGPLGGYEEEKLATLGAARNGKSRTPLNLHYVADSGRAELEEMLSSGTFRVYVPEEGALLVAAWLIMQNEADKAGNLVQTLLPFFDRLRFYPVPNPVPLRLSAGVAAQSVGDSVLALRRQKPKRAVQAMKEAIEVWTPLYDRAASLFLETVEGDRPGLQKDALGSLVRAPNGQPIVVGGWPCRRFASDWEVRAHQLLEDYNVARAKHRNCGKPERKRENFARLRDYLARSVQASGDLTERDLGMLRRVLASYVTKHGAPGSARLAQARVAQEKNASATGHSVLAGVLADRFEGVAQDEGDPDVLSKLEPVAEGEAGSYGAIAGEAFPPRLRLKALRCLEASPEVLLEHGILASSESLARVLPSITANVRASAIADARLRRLYQAVYSSFRRRRSLLLLNLESQVKFNELPWVHAIESWVGDDEESRRASRDVLTRTICLTLNHFPYTIVPNKLVKELRALALVAGEAMPLVDELAADIFMGAFSGNFLDAAKASGALLKGSIYARYYGVPYDEILGLDDVKQDKWGAKSSAGFAKICGALAEHSVDGKWSVASNGCVIEQAQVATTHNLAVLVEFLNRADARRPDFTHLAQRCFEWVCKRQQLTIREWKAQMQNVKNCAFAWRQMVFYLSLLDTQEVNGFIEWSRERLSSQSEGFRSRFEPVECGLEVVAQGEHFGVDGVHAGSGGRRFLGWSTKRHWLLPSAR